MFTLFCLKLCGCFGIRKKRRKPGTNMKEVFQSGALESFKLKKAVRFKQDENTLVKNALLRNRTGYKDDIKQDPSSALSHEPKGVQGVKPIVVLVEGIQCRSQLKCNARPVGICEPRVHCCSGAMQA